MLPVFPFCQAQSLANMSPCPFNTDSLSYGFCNNIEFLSHFSFSTPILLDFFLGHFCFLHQKNKHFFGHQGAKLFFFTFLIFDPYSFRQLFFIICLGMFLFSTQKINIFFWPPGGQKKVLFYFSHFRPLLF